MRLPLRQSSTATLMMISFSYGSLTPPTRLRHCQGYKIHYAFPYSRLRTPKLPSKLVYDIDPVRFGVLGFTNYIAKISCSDYQNGPTWVDYSAKESYGSLLTQPVTDFATELALAFWHNVTELFVTDDDVFDGYIARKTRDYDVFSCTGSCKNETTCDIPAGDAQYNCLVLTPGFDFTNRGEAEHAPAKKKCDDPGLVLLLGEITTASKNL